MQGRSWSSARVLSAKRFGMEEKMKDLTQRKWFVWLTAYWFLFPVAGFLLLAAGVFFGYGERSYIGVHDNMDLFLAQFQMLKKELEVMGMFAAEYKQPIPAYAGRIGVVTAPTGAAVRDIMNIAARRNPYVQLILYPAQVQGDGAAESIVNGIPRHILITITIILAIVGL